MFSHGLGWNLNSAVRVEACFSMQGQPKSVLTAAWTVPHSYMRQTIAAVLKEGLLGLMGILELAVFICVRLVWCSSVYHSTNRIDPEIWSWECCRSLNEMC